MSEQKLIRDKPIPEYKREIVESLKERILNNRTVLIASCKSLPGLQFHEIKKKLRGKAEIKFARKSAIKRAIDETKKGSILGLKDLLDSDFAVIFSDIEPFELAGILLSNQSKSKAKAGEISPRDIEVEPCSTDLPAGPAISELQGVGLKVKVTDGKLEIIKGAVIVKEGEEISSKVASVLAKLNILPMKVGFIPLVAYDSKDEKVYENIKIDREGALEAMREMIGKALGFAVSVGYPTSETIKFFISRAAMEEKAIMSIVGNSEVKEEAPAEEVKEESNSTEIKEDKA